MSVLLVLMLMSPVFSLAHTFAVLMLHAYI